MSFSSFTKTQHSSSYPAISPLRPELSCKDKTVIITGGGQGIGAATALSYAKAGATKIALIGRTESKLQDTKSKVELAYPDVEVCIAAADISDAESVGRAAHDVRVTLGAWDVFVHCAGVRGSATRMTGADIDEWWSIFEINTKFLIIFAKHFLTKCRLPGATFIYANAGTAHMLVDMMPPVSSYAVSKLAAAKLCEWLAKENPGLRVFSVHPGTIKTPNVDKFLAQTNDGSKGLHDLKFGDIDLASDFFVWCASPEAEFLRGKFVWANWDVEEMMQKRAELETNPMLLRIGLGGWPFTQE